MKRRTVVNMLGGVLAVFSADASQAQETPKAISLLQKLEAGSGYYKDGKDALELRDAKLAGQLSQDKIDRGLNAIDSLGGKAAETTAVAAGGRLLGATSALTAPTLMAVAKSESKVLGELTAAQKRVQDAFVAGDYSEMARRGEELDRIRASAAQFKPDYGSVWDPIINAAKYAGRQSADAGLNFLKSTIQSLTSDAANQPTAPKTPVCGSMEWYDSVGGTCRPQEQAEQPQPQKSMGWRPAQGGQCSFPDMDFEGMADVLGKQAGGCQLVQRTKSDTQIKYVLNCGTRLAAMFAQKVSEDQVVISFDFEGGGAFRQTAFVRCDSDQPVEDQCSPSARTAWKSTHPGQPMYQCP